MGLVSLYLFTLLGGLAAGTYVFETCFRRERTGDRPWLIPLIVCVLFAVGLVAAATHVHSIPRAVGSVLSGTVNFGSGMIQEVAVAGCFLILAVIDLVVTVVRKDSPIALRIVTAIVGVACMVLMGIAYTDVYGNAIWCDAPATVLLFLAGDLAMGLAFYALLDNRGFDEGALRITSIVVSVVLAVGLCLEIAAFTGEGASPVALAIALIVAPIASIVLAVAAPKMGSRVTPVAAVCVLSIVGIAVARYAFYATCTVL